MTEEERKEYFLSDFKELENALISIAKIKEEGHVSFSRALNAIYFGRLEPRISNYECYDFLKTAADLRNILSHENNVCVPTEAYLKRFHDLKEAIVHPVTCYDICTKDVIYCSLDETLRTVTRRMAYKSLSHLPILDEERHVLGVFSRSTVFDYLSLNEEFTYSEDSKVSDFEEVTGVDDHLNEVFVFVPRYFRIDKAYPYLKKNVHQKNLGLLLVTEHGKKNEKLLGVISLVDLMKVKY